MKVFLDDERQTPEDWKRVPWPDEAVELLKTGKVTHISLDHDLSAEGGGNLIHPPTREGAGMSQESKTRGSYEPVFSLTLGEKQIKIPASYREDEKDVKDGLL